MDVGRGSSADLAGTSGGRYRRFGRTSGGRSGLLLAGDMAGDGGFGGMPGEMEEEPSPVVSTGALQAENADLVARFQNELDDARLVETKMSEVIGYLCAVLVHCSFQLFSVFRLTASGYPVIRFRSRCRGAPRKARMFATLHFVLIS